jgi:hypothetical protein
MQVKPKTYNQFKELLFKASPEVKEDVMELEFGQYITGNGYHNARIIIFHQKIADGFIATVSKGNYVIDENIIFKNEDIRIIGRDITLEDLLRAFESKYRTAYEIIKGRKEEATLLWMNIFNIWQLGKPAHLQSEETIQSIINLLK